MKGIMLCKFDENKGYIPLKIYPSKIYSSTTNKQLFRDIAKNAIGFGTNIEYNQFEISGVNAYSRRFTRPASDARGGVEIYSLVVLNAEPNEIDKSTLEKFTSQLISEWDNRNLIIKEVYNKLFFKINDKSLIEEKEEDSSAINYDKTSITPSTAASASKPEKSEYRKSILFRNELLDPEKKSIFAMTYNPIRNFFMIIGMFLIIIILYFKYDFISFVIMFNSGLLFFSVIDNRKIMMRICASVLVFFIIYMLIGLFLDSVYNITLLLFPSFIDLLVPPLWAILSFLSGFFICIGLDRGKTIDKISTIIGIIFLGIDLIFFLLIPIILPMF